MGGEVTWLVVLTVGQHGMRRRVVRPAATVGRRRVPGDLALGRAADRRVPGRRRAAARDPAMRRALAPGQRAGAAAGRRVLVLRPEAAGPARRKAGALDRAAAGQAVVRVLVLVDRVPGARQARHDRAHGREARARVSGQGLAVRHEVKA